MCFAIRRVCVRELGWFTPTFHSSTLALTAAMIGSSSPAMLWILSVNSLTCKLHTRAALRVIRRTHHNKTTFQHGKEKRKKKPQVRKKLTLRLIYKVSDKKKKDIVASELSLSLPQLWCEALISMTERKTHSICSDAAQRESQTNTIYYFKPASLTANKLESNVSWKKTVNIILFLFNLVSVSQMINTAYWIMHYKRLKWSSLFFMYLCVQQLHFKI